MMFIMDSYCFFGKFIPSEDTKTVLDASYIVVSTKIRRRRSQDDYGNIIVLNNTLYPSSSVFSVGRVEDMKDEYHKQLEELAIPFLARLVLYCIEDGMNIIFLSNHGEYKMGYLQWLAEFMYLYFGYPVYEYDKFCDGCPMIEYDEQAVHKLCKKIIKDAEKTYKNEQKKTKIGRRVLVKEYMEMSKKQLMKLLKKKGIDASEMTKQEMVDILEVYL